MELVFFIVTAVLCVGAAIAMLLSHNAVHSALWLVLNFFGVAVLYLLLNAPFLAMVQITVYAGAIMVLFLFVIMLLGSEKGQEELNGLPWETPVALVLGLVLLGMAGLRHFRRRSARAAGTSAECRPWRRRRPRSCGGLAVFYLLVAV